MSGDKCQRQVIRDRGIEGPCGYPLPCWRHPTPEPSEVAETTAGERECRYPCGCDQFPEDHCACMDGHTPAEPDAGEAS